MDVFGQRYWLDETSPCHSYKSRSGAGFLLENDGTWCAWFSAAAAVSGAASPEEAIKALGAKLKEKLAAHMREMQLEHERRMKGLGL